MREGKMKGYQYLTSARGSYLQPFNYHKAKSLSEAASLLEEYGDEARLLAGGTALLPLMRAQKLNPEHIVDITGNPQLDYIMVEQKIVRMGPLANLRSVGQHTFFRDRLQAVYEAIHMLTVQVQNMCTLGGNICALRYGGIYGSVDLPAVLLALNTAVKVITSDGGRVVPMENLTLKTEEIVNEIQIPIPPDNTGTAYIRIGRLSEDRVPKINVAVLLTVSNGICDDVRIAGTAPTPYRALKAEEILKGKSLSDETVEAAAGALADEIKSVTDTRSTAEYRKEVAKVIANRGIKTALERTRKLGGG